MLTCKTVIRHDHKLKIIIFKTIIFEGSEFLLQIMNNQIQLKVICAVLFEYVCLSNDGSLKFKIAEYKLHWLENPETQYRIKCSLKIYLSS